MSLTPEPTEAVRQSEEVNEQNFCIQQIAFYDSQAERLTQYADTMAVARPPLHTIREAIIRRRAWYSDRRASMAVQRLAELNLDDL